MKRWLKTQIALRSGVDLLNLYYRRNGILRYENFVVSGEDFFVRNVLKSSLPRNAALFDVGAHIGEYSALLLKHVPHARIFAFEPNPAAFRRLSDRFSVHNTAVTAINVGLGAAPGERELYDYSRDEGSFHASLYPESLKRYRASPPTSIKVMIKTLESICSELDIEHLHFLKLDTEGSELAVLEGGRNLISQRKIDVIQFEFSDLNVISRVYLRDFYDVLPQYTMFRLSESGLIPLGEYDTRNEIFNFQNIVAVRMDIAGREAA